MLGLLTNTSSLSVQRQLNQNQTKLQTSLERLSSGLRINRASDDVASMAIGSRLNAELVALKTVAVNAGQATSLLQIGEGTYARVNDMLVRMKSLSAQSANGTLSNTERGLLNVEYEALLEEISRVSRDTTFNGQKLVDSPPSISVTTGGGPFMVIGSFGLNTGDNQSLTYDATTRTFSGTINGVFFSGTINENLIDTDDTLIQDTVLEVAGNDGIGRIVLLLTSNFDTSNDTPVNDITDLDVISTGARTFDFRIGSGSNPAEDIISARLYGVTTDALGLNKTNIATQADATLIAERLSAAINMVISARAVVGSSQNRIETARVNLATTIENTEAAKSAYLDADIAAEITAYTSTQILVQTGLSTLAQANQIPRALLSLFQN